MTTTHHPFVCSIFTFLLSFVCFQGIAQKNEIKAEVSFKNESRTETNNPFVSYLGGEQSAPAFGDIDNDEDMDLVVGYKYYVLFYENVQGNFASGISANVKHHRMSFRLIRNQYKVAFGDLNGDGKTDGICDKEGKLHYINFGHGEEPQDKVGGLISGTGYPFSTQAPALADVNGDGKLDIISRMKVGSEDYVSYIPNETKKVGAPKFGTEQPIFSIPKSMFAPAFVDLDKDGDLDIVYGTNDGKFVYYQNNGNTRGAKYKEFNATNPKNPFFGFDVGDGAYPAFFDFDFDGDLDLFSGAKSGKIHLFENTTGEFCSFGDEHDYRWEILNKGEFDGELFSMTTDNSGNVYVGGNFRSIGGVDMKNSGIAKWDNETGEWINILPNPNPSMVASACRKVIHDSTTDMVYFAINWCNSDDCVSSVYKFDASKDSISGEYLPAYPFAIDWFSRPITDIAVHKGTVYATFGEVDNEVYTSSDGLLVEWQPNSLMADSLFGNPKKSYQSVVIKPDGKVYFTEAGYSNHSTELNGTLYWYNDEKNMSLRTMKNIAPYFKVSLGPKSDWIYQFGNNRSYGHHVMNLTMKSKWFWPYQLEYPKTVATFLSLPHSTFNNDMYVLHTQGAKRLMINHWGPSNDFKAETKVLYNNPKEFIPKYTALHIDSMKNLYTIGKFEDADGGTSSRVIRRQFIPCVKPDSKANNYEFQDGFATMDGECEVLIKDSRGNLYAGGEFNKVSDGKDTVDCHRIAMWNRATKKWEALGKGLDLPPNAFAFDSAGNLIVGGDFTEVDGKSIKHIAKWDPNSKMWSAFGGGYEIIEECLAIAFDKKGKLYIGGGTYGGGGYVAHWEGKYWQYLPMPMNQEWKDGWSANNLLFDSDGNLLIELQGSYTPPRGTASRKAIAVTKWKVKEQKYAKDYLFFNDEADQYTSSFVQDACNNRLLVLQTEDIAELSDIYFLPPDAKGDSDAFKSNDSEISSQNGEIHLTLSGSHFYGISSDGFFQYNMESHKKIAEVKDDKILFNALIGGPNQGFYASGSKGGEHFISRIVKSE